MTAPAAARLSVDRARHRREDPTSSHPELGGGYVAYSASGTASGQVVYVNYGLPADYARARDARRVAQGPHRAGALWPQPSRREDAHGGTGRRAGVGALQRPG